MSLAIQQYAKQVERLELAPYQVGHPDHILWTLIQGGICNADKEVLSPARQQVKCFAAVGLSRLLCMFDAEREQNVNLEVYLGQVEKMVHASDHETTVSWTCFMRLLPWLILL